MKPTNFMKLMSKKRLMGAISARPTKAKPMPDSMMEMDPEMAKKKKKMMGGM